MQDVCVESRQVEKDPARLADREFLAYTAGFFDADGSVGIYFGKTERLSRGGRFAMRVRIGQAVWMPIFLEWQERWGGSFHKSENGWRGWWTWLLTTKRASKFLEDILPHLRLKREQAELAIEFQKKLKKGFGRSDVEFDWQKSMSEALKEMKRNPGLVSADVLESIMDKLSSIGRQLRLWPGGNYDV